MAELSETDEIARLLTILIRLELGTQSQTIDELSKIGFSTKRIAELLGTTANTVNVAIQKQRRKSPSKAPAKKARRQ